MKVFLGLNFHIFMDFYSKLVNICENLYWEKPIASWILKFLEEK
jgi:hypothetical protein